MPTPNTEVNKHLETLGLKHDDLNEDAIRVAYKKLVSYLYSEAYSHTYTTTRLCGGIRIATMRTPRR